MTLSHLFISTVLFPLRRKEKWICVKTTWLLTYNQVIYFLKKNRADKKGWSIAMCSSKLLQQCPKQHGPVLSHTRFVTADLIDELHLHKEHASNQETLTHSIGSTPAISAHLPCREQHQPRPPAEINLALQPNKKSFWPDTASMGGTVSACFPAAENNFGKIQGE